MGSRGLLTVAALLATAAYACAFVSSIYTMDPVNRSPTVMMAKGKKGPAKARVKGSPLNVEVVAPLTPAVSSFGAPEAAVSNPPKTVAPPAVEKASTDSITSAAPPVKFGANEIPSVVPRLVVLDLDKTCW